MDEAVAELDKYLDDAYLAHLPSVRIVHGKGTGALRKRVHDMLPQKKHVKSYRLGEFGEGDAGVTIATSSKPDQLNRRNYMAAKQKILIVDDDENIAELISLYLTKECYDTMIVHDGEEALNAFKTFPSQPDPPGSDAAGHRRLSGVPGDPHPLQRPSSCSPPRERSLTRCWGWSWAPTTIS